MSGPGALTPGRAARAQVAAARRRANPQGRTAFAGAYAVGVALGPAAVLTDGAIGLESPVAAFLILGWIGLILLAGFGLLVYAITERDARGARALLLAALALAASIALFAPAARAGREMFVNRHRTELDALARDILAAPDLVRGYPVARVPGASRGDSLPGAARSGAAALLARSGRLGLTHFEVGSGGVLLGSATLFAPDLLYRDGEGDPVPAWCARAELRWVGGRWYLFTCRSRRD